MSGKKKCPCGNSAKRRWCSRHCQNVYGSREYYAKNRATRVAYAKKRHRDTKGAAAARYRQRHRQELNAKAKERGKTDLVKAQRRERRRKNPGKFKAKAKEQRARDKAKGKGSSWERVTPEKATEYRRTASRNFKKKLLEMEFSLLSAILAGKLSSD